MIMPGTTEIGVVGEILPSAAIGIKQKIYTATGPLNSVRRAGYFLPVRGSGRLEARTTMRGHCGSLGHR
jgi:hypothetical protein